MTITTKRPNGDFANSSWKDQASATTNLYQKIDDAVTDDATYIGGDLKYPPGLYQANLEDVTVPAGSRILRVLGRARVRARSTGQTSGFRLALQDTGTGKKSGEPQVVYASTAWTEWDTGWWTTAPGGIEWTQAVWNRTIANMLTHYYQPTLLVSEVWFDVDVRAPGVLGTPTVAGATTTTRVTGSWAFTPNADNDPQQWYRAKVFRSDVYSATGFSPDTSPAVWDSGVVTNTVTFAQVGVDLLNGSTYKFYVNAAQSFNGDAWWVGWQGSAAFTISLTPPRTPVITVTPRTALPVIGNQVAVQASQNQLNATMASFEDTATGYPASGTNCSVARSTTVGGADGAAALRLSSTASGTMSVEATTRVSVRAGVTYTLRAVARAGASVRATNVGMRWYDTAGSPISTTTGSNVNDAVGTWAMGPVFVTGAAPATAKTMAPVLTVVSTGGVAELHYWDAVDVHPGTATTFTPGGGYDNGVLVVEFHDAVSPRTGGPANWAHPHLAGGPGDVLDDASGLFPRNPEDVVAAEPLNPIFGTRSLRWTPFNPAFDELYVGMPMGTFADEGPPFLLPAVPGVQMTLSVWARASAGFSSKLWVRTLATDGTSTGGDQNTGAITIPTGATRYAVTVTPPAGTVWCEPSLENSGSVTGVDVVIAGFDWRRGATAPATPGAGTGPLTREWKPLRGGAAVAVGTRPDQLYVVQDTEVPPGRIRIYRARVQVNVGSTDQSNSANSTYVPVLNPALAAGQYIVKDPAYPAGAVLAKITGIREQVGEVADIANPLGQGTDRMPVTVGSFIGGEDGTLTWTTEGEDEYHRAYQLIHAQRVLLLQVPEGGQRYIRFQGDRSVERRTLVNTCDGPVTYRTITVPFLQSLPPPVVT